MGILQLCMNCWKEIPLNTIQCGHCGTDPTRVPDDRDDALTTSLAVEAANQTPARELANA